MAKCDLAAWAVAWATDNQVLEAAFEHRAKFRHLVVGTHGYVTAPSVIERFQEMPNFKVMLPEGPLFHPKVYLFRSKEDWTAVVGSHNLTNRAFTTNIEASTLMRGNATDAGLQKLFAFVAQSWGAGVDVTPEWLYSYQANHRRAKAAHDELARWVPVKKSKAEDDIPGPQDLAWQEFVARVKIENPNSDHTLEGRLQVLEQLGAMFRSKPTYAELDVDVRKRIAGTMGGTQAKKDGHEWAWFGAMGASGSFSTTVINKPEGLSRALDFIPQTGPVNLEHYELFREEFMGALSEDLRASGGIATGTRLLAMKRPDQFVCISRPNKKGIAEHFAVANNTSLDNYWERIVLRIRSSPWWLAPEPTDPLEKRIWAGRAALLDAIYYDPATR
ncbi:hypothetical protein APY03_0794 [Variovorax sp. WDL1]|nr:hypothetical protein APY03_0794 [Variovorax sp. WDL1]